MKYLSAETIDFGDSSKFYHLKPVNEPVFYL